MSALEQEKEAAERSRFEENRHRGDLQDKSVIENIENSLLMKYDHIIIILIPKGFVVKFA